MVPNPQRQAAVSLSGVPASRATSLQCPSIREAKAGVKRAWVREPLQHRVDEWGIAPGSRIVLVQNHASGANIHPEPKDRATCIQFGRF